MKPEESLAATMLKQLVKEHKQNCKDSECNMSMFMIYQYFYEPFVGKKQAKKDFKLFI